MDLRHGDSHQRRTGYTRGSKMAATQQSVYLCYTAEDRDFAALFAAGLDHYGFRVWSRWTASEVPVASSRISESDCVAVLWSRSAQKEKAVLEGIGFALARKKRLIPVRIEDAPPAPQLLEKSHIDLIGWKGNPQDPRFLEIVVAVGGGLNTRPSEAAQTRVVKGFQRQVVQRAERLFQENLRAESKLEYVELEQTAFYDQVRWNLTSGMNILLGRNGYGKTYLLRGMLALLQYEDDVAAQTLANGSGTISLLRDSEEERTIHFEKEFFEEEDAVGKLPVLAIPDMRFVNRSSTLLTPMAPENGESDLGDLAANGAWHFLRERPYDSMIQSFLYGLCLDYWEHDRKFIGEEFDLIRGVVRELTDRSFEFERVTRDREKFTLYVRTEGNESNPLPIQKASQGTLSVVAMFGLIYDFLKALRQESGDVLQRSGIVVIDEVDAHLHPYWQQKIVSLLRGRFPRVQFIITAHNPIVVAGCLEDEVSVLRKNAERGFSLVQFPNDFIGWQPEEIYRRVFELENPDETFTRYDALRPFKGQLEEEAAELAQRESRSPDEERALEEIEEKLLYIEKVQQTRSRRISQEEMERENRTLRDRVLGLESAHESAARAQRELEAAQQATAWEREKLQATALDAERRLRIWKAASCIMLAIVLVTLAYALLR